MSNMAKTLVLLGISNVFMLAAWYFHLKQWAHKPWYAAAFLSWCIAFCEYSVHIPANRIGSTVFSLPQLQVLQVGMSLVFFLPFAVFVMRRPVSMDYVWSALCLAGAAFFIFRETHPLGPVEGGTAESVLQAPLE